MRTHAPIALPSSRPTTQRDAGAQPSSPQTCIDRITTQTPTKMPPFRDAEERLIFRVDCVMVLNHSTEDPVRATPAFGSSEVAKILRGFGFTCLFE